MNLKNQTRLGHYKILEKLGAGGMGEVLSGEDARFDCEMSLKITPAEFGAAELTLCIWTK